MSLVDLLQTDWNVFNIEGLRTRQRLLKKISGDDDIFKTKFKPRYATELNNIEQWEKFREELKHNNRFFPNNAPLKSDIQPFGKYIGVILGIGRQKFYRARINTSTRPIDISEMGKPDKLISSNGRANPIGIPYLYVASTIPTAIAEIRGHIGEKLTIAEFDIIDDLELADLRDPKNTISPFQLNDDDEMELIYKNMPYLTLLGSELSKPIIPRDANLEYLPSQFLCELIKHIGFHGIIYKSSVSDGNNYVIFNEGKLAPVITYQYQITGIETYFQEL